MENNQPDVLILKDITGAAFEVYNEFHEGLLESAYEAAMKYLLQKKGYQVEQQVYVPMYFKGVKLEQNYRIDLLVNRQIIIELKALEFVGKIERRQLQHYLMLTHIPFGMLINFGADGVYSERWFYDVKCHSCHRLSS